MRASKFEVGSRTAPHVENDEVSNRSILSVSSEIVLVLGPPPSSVAEAQHACNVLSRRGDDWQRSRRFDQPQDVDQGPLSN